MQSKIVLPFVLLATLLTAHEVCAADTRLRGSSVDGAAQRLGAGQQPSGLADIGYVVADGLVFIPSGSVELGYASNPDLLFSNAKGSPYGNTEGSAVLGYISPKGATTVAVKGRVNTYDSDIERPERWDAGISVDNAYTIATHVVATGGVYALRDEIYLVPSDNHGGYGQIGYKDADIETFSKIKSDQVNYLGRQAFPASISPTLAGVLQPRAFDVQRTESITGFLIAPQAFLGIYGEVGGAQLDYLSQPSPDIVDRNATEGWIRGGVRLNPTKTLRVETGWRYNNRQTDDHRVSEYSSNFFDGRLTWTPTPQMQLVIDIDRKLVEPVTTFAIVCDQTLYTLTSVYKPSAEWQWEAFGKYRRLDQIGDVQQYREYGGGLTAGYQLTPKTSIYGVASYNHGEEIFSQQTYDSYRVGAGTQTKF